MFSTKDPIPRGLCAGVVYKFLCAGGNACHVGETARLFSTRVREDIFSDRTSHICSNNCISILDHASTIFQLNIKDVIHI